MAMLPNGIRPVSRCAVSAAMTAITASTTMDRASLSDVPNS
jgi:hypothetical protein